MIHVDEGQIAPGEADAVGEPMDDRAVEQINADAFVHTGQSFGGGLSG